MTSDLGSIASSSSSPSSQERILNSDSTPGIPVVPSNSPKCAVEETVKSSVPGVKERYDNIVKLERDTKEYRGLLLTNRIKVLLVSCPIVYRSAAALELQVGNYSDPDDIPGLAHFCEHMVFLGTEKYPEENVFQKFTSEHGGENNAITVADGTIFYFDVNSAHLAKGLDIFAQFFISPLFTESATTRELDSVNSEHENNVASDNRRLFNLKKHICDPSHPYKKFMTGNKETLKTIPESKGIDVRKELLKFHEKWYSSNIMSLVVTGKESLDELEAMVVPLFSTIKDKSITAPSWPLNPIPLELRRKKIYGVPIKDTRELTIDFAIPCQSKHYKSKPADYLTRLISHSGPGSLLLALKRRGWCNSIYSYDITPARGFAFFYIGVIVTSEGINHIDDIISIIFQYLAVLKKEGPQQWLWEEQRHLMELNYHFNGTKSSIDMVQDYAPLLQDYPIEDILTIQNLKTEWKPELITDLLSLLTPENAVVTIYAKAFEEKCTMTDQWYETKYGFEDIDESTLKKWKEVQPCEELHMPPPNEFIPAALTPGKEIAPAIVKDTSLMRLWYKKNKYRDAEITFRMVSSMVDAEPLNCYLCGLWLEVVSDKLQEVTYGATQAGMKWKVSGNEDGIIINVEGFEEKLDLLLYKIIDQFVGFKADPKRFQVLKTDFYSSLENDINDTQPIELAIEEEKACLSAWYLAASGSEGRELMKRKATQQGTFFRLEDLTPAEQLNEFAVSFIRKVHIESFIHGDISREKALTIADSVEEKFPKDGIPLLAAQLQRNRTIELDQGAWYIRKINTEVHRESCASVYYSCGISEMKGKLVLKLLSQLLQEPCYTTLRTKEQLGYKVYCEFVSYDSAHGLRIRVQGEKHPKFLDQRIEEFVQNFSEVLQNLSDEELLKAKSSVTIVDDLWNEITSQVYNFDRTRLEEKMLKEITKEDIIMFYKKYLRQDSPDRAKLSIYVISIAEGGAGEKDSKTTKEKQEEKVTQVDDEQKPLSEDSPGGVEQSVNAIVTEEKDTNKEDLTPSKQKQEENTIQNKEKPLSEDSSGGAEHSGDEVTTEEKDANKEDLTLSKQKQEENATKSIDKEKSLSEDSRCEVETSVSAVTIMAKYATEEDKKQKPLSEDSPGVTELSISVSITVKVGTNKEDITPTEQKVTVAQKSHKALVEPEITKTTVEAGENLKPTEQEQVIQVTQKSDKIQLQLKINVESTAKGVGEEDFKPAEQEQEESDTQKTDEVLQQPEIITDLLDFKSRRRLYPHPTPFMNIPRKGL